MHNEHVDADTGKGASGVSKMTRISTLQPPNKMVFHEYYC
jgi:hypothetical protein